MARLTLPEVEETKRSPAFSYRKRNWLQRLGWHIKAYVPIIGVAVLVGLSLGVLHLHRLLIQLFVKKTAKSVSVAQEELEVRGN